MRYIRLQYPKVLAVHIANERKTSLQRGAKLKRMGVLAGMPDIMIYENRINKETNKLNNVGLAIELKIKPNKPTKNQLAVLDKLKKRGWQTHVCYDFDKTINVINDYFK